MQPIKAIETVYRGYKFRSRAEARFAVFLDALRVPWEYEKEGYQLPSGWYLPDFWIPHLKCWIEIKPEAPTDQASILAGELAVATNCNVYVFYGPVPGFDIEDGSNGWEVYGDSGEAFFPPFDDDSDGPGWDNLHKFCVCDDCGSVGIEFDGRSDRLACKECYACNDARRGIDVNGYLAVCPRGGKCQGRCRRSGHGDKGYTYDHPRIINAVTAARSARFEHGESPRI